MYTSPYSPPTSTAACWRNKYRSLFCFGDSWPLLASDVVFNFLKFETLQEGGKAKAVTVAHPNFLVLPKEIQKIYTIYKCN